MMEAVKVRKAIFPVGGLGTRFLPATKATPKEMLPIVDKPLIQYAAEEAIAAGIDTLIFVNGRNKRAIPDHFDTAYELEKELECKGKHKLLAEIRGILPSHVDCIYIRQSEALGLGHAVLCAEKAVGNEPVAIILADDLIDGGKRPCLSQMTDVFARWNKSVIAVEPVAPDKTDQYGIVKVADVSGKLGRIEQIIEKPKPEEAPSNLGVVGRYILTPRIFDLLRITGRGAGGEIQLTDAISVLLAEEAVNAYQFEGVRYDCGSKMGFLEANIDFALQHPQLRAQMISHLDRTHRKVMQGLRESA